jgi:probable rRNA maturation factor
MTAGNFEITLINDNEYFINLDEKQIIHAIIELESFSNDFDVSVVFVDNQEIIKLNQEFFGYAKPTDVLSFYSGDIDPETGRLILGDIIISYPFAKSQALQLKNDLMAELSLLIIHGFLHLLDYDHSNSAEKNLMWKKQKSILDKLNIDITNYPE